MPDGSKVTANTPPITQKQAEEMLLNSIARVYEPQVRREIRVQLTQNQYDACVSFCFNLGSMLNVGKEINAGTIKRATWLKYVYAKGKKLEGLVRRRNKEADLFYEI
jgi:lysozyme